MPILNSIKRRMVEYLATQVNELHIGSDGTDATEDDGGARSMASIVPTVTVLDDLSIEVQGTFDASHIYSSQVQEVYLQYRDATTGEFVPIYRASIMPVTKDGKSEMAFSFILEVE